MRTGLLMVVMGALLATAGAAYQRAEITGGGHCFRWPAGNVVFSQSVAGDPALGDAGFDAVTRSWQTWQAQMQACGNLTLSEGSRVASRTVGFSVDGGANQNENLILFRPVLCTAVVDAGDSCHATGSCANLHDCWDDSPAALGVTTSSYRTADGVLLDTDIELNAATFFFTTVDTPPCDAGTQSLDCVVYDTQNATTHEFGHVLGLAHSPDPTSTMFATAAPGETSKRVLDPGSLQFVCDVYPMGGPSLDCVVSDAGPGGTPDSGPAPAPSGGTASGCGCATGGTGPGTATGIALLIALGWARRRH